MNTRKKRRVKDEIVNVAVAGRSVTTLLRGGGLSHVASKCAYHDVDEMSECDICRLAMLDIRELQDYVAVDVDPKALRAFFDGWKKYTAKAAA